jgi:hypothetical protein
MAKVASKLQVEARIHSFDAATARQKVRNKSNRRRTQRRDWIREGLYDRVRVR